jgi:hypothetical protein
MSEKLPWTIETMDLINKLTSEIKGKAFDPDWFLLRQRFEEIEYALQDRERTILTMRRNQKGVKGS